MLRYQSEIIASINRSIHCVRTSQACGSAALYKRRPP